MNRCVFLLGITLEPTTLADFMTFLTLSPHSHAINFQEFRDFLMLMPREASAAEIFRYYEVKKFMGDDGRGAARVNMEGMCVYGVPPMSTVKHSISFDCRRCNAKRGRYVSYSSASDASKARSAADTSRLRGPR